MNRFGLFLSYFIGFRISQLLRVPLHSCGDWWEVYLKRIPTTDNHQHRRDKSSQRNNNNKSSPQADIEAEDFLDFNQLHAYERTKEEHGGFTGELFERCENPSKSLSVYAGQATHHDEV